MSNNLGTHRLITEGNSPPRHLRDLVYPFTPKLVIKLSQSL